MALTQQDKERLTASQQQAVQRATDAYNAAYAKGDKAGMQAAANQAAAIRNAAGYETYSNGTYKGQLSTSSSGNRSTGSSSAPAYTAYTSQQLNGMTAAQLQSLASQNSANWAGADAATQTALHNQNTQIRSILDALNNTTSTFDSKTGMWTTTPNAQQALVRSSGGTPVYTPSAWDATKEALAQAALHMNYEDWTDSDQYRALASRYGYNGKLSMQDVLGQIASRTGGLASSYATTAAQQQYNDYMAQLEEAARSMYSNERNDALQNAQLAYEFSDDDYQRYLDRLAQYNNDRNFGYQTLSDALAQSNYANEWAAKQEEAANNRNLRQADTLAEYGDFSGYEALGYTASQIAAMQAAYAAAQSAANARQYGGGSTSSANSSTSSANGGANWANVEAWAERYGEDAVEDYIKEHYKDLGYSSQSAALAGWANHTLQSDFGWDSDFSYQRVDADIQALVNVGANVNEINKAILSSGLSSTEKAALQKKYMWDKLNLGAR